MNGAAVALDGQHDENYPVAKLRVAVNPGASVNMAVDIVAVKPGKKTLGAIVPDGERVNGRSSGARLLDGARRLAPGSRER